MEIGETYEATAGAAAAAGAELAAAGAADGVTGQTVVETATTEVTTMVALAGHEVTVGPQLVTVTKLVEYTVEVVYDGCALMEVMLAADMPASWVGVAVARAAKPRARAADEYFILILVVGLLIIN